ncbi:histidine kinase [Flavitalea sp. BT771]|uniref:ligand-binding sensor domain-containing protein n=1 Tax=Flavitalea sp. BT771 TaxID=3063329 RepID=UPI0026E18D08|nr:sensor histidine kinase [Flavitalea sp. BT771]MDO6430847.1 histidine kinase [Flavitalea sp. BT771]MDV6219013.1 histidine kinase [Flavitalea sp. BT771]
MRYWCWLILLLPYTKARAQVQTTNAKPLAVKYNFRNIDNNNGLNSNDVYSLTQDRKGYIWIGTEKGLQRYDGLRFMDCFNPDAKPGSQSVYYVYPDNARGGIFYEQPDQRPRQWSFLTNTSTELAPEELMSTAAGATYRGWNNKSWTIWEYWTDSSSQKGDQKGLALLKEPGNDRYHRAVFIKDEQRRQTWIRDSTYGLLLLNDRDKTVSSPQFNPGNDPLLAAVKTIAANFHKIVADGRGNIWLLNWSDSFYRFDRHTQKLSAYSLASILEQQGNQAALPCWVSDVLMDDHGVLWLATAKAGLLSYDFETNSFRYLLRQPGNNLALQYNHQINAIFQDREENIWLGTDKGICIFNPYRMYFSTLSCQDPAKPSMAINQISAATLTSTKDLWTGSWGGGINVYDEAFRLKKHFFFNREYDKNMVWSFVEQENRVIWAGCQHGFLHIIDSAGRLVKTIRPPETEARTIKCMVRDKDGNTLLGLHNGKIIVFSRQQSGFIPYNDRGQPSSVTLSSIESLFVDDHGTCWAGTWNGLGEYDIQKRCFIAVHHPYAGSNVRCWGINRYNDSVLIVSTENYGLYFFNRRTKIFSKVPVNEERPHWSAYAVETDAQGKIWFSTDYSIGNYDPVSKKAFVCQPEKGLINTSFSGCNFLHSTTGKWITWTNSEIVAFLPEEINAVRKRAMPVTITGFKVFSNPLFTDSLTTRQMPVQLSYKENFIGIEFSNLQFSDIERTKYYYRLEGVDRDWVYGGTRGYASYTNLPPGSYTFLARTENGDNIRDTAILSIRIAAPFWATVWFRVLVAAAATFLIFFLFRWYNRGLRQEARMKQQIATTEMMALRAQMNPHFIFNCINSIDALIQSNDKYLATVYLNKFARLIRNILDSSKQHTISLTRDLETLQLYIDLELFRNENRFTAEIRVDDSLLEEDYRVPPLIVQPYVENAILHGLRHREGTSGRLIISISKINEHLIFLVEDNGVGRSAAISTSQHRSYGMEMSRDRVNLFNREEHIPVVITDLVQEGQPAGTRVQVSLKIS